MDRPVAKQRGGRAILRATLVHPGTSLPSIHSKQLTSEPPLQGQELVTARPAAAAVAAAAGGLAGGAAPRAAWAATWRLHPARRTRREAVQGHENPL